jgi:hypothetical protein
VYHLSIGDFQSKLTAVRTSCAMKIIDKGDTGPRIGKLIGSIVVRSRCMYVCVCVRMCVCACVCVCVLDHKIYGRLAVSDVVALDGTYSEQEVSVYFTGGQTLVNGFCTIVAGLSVELKEAMLASRNSSTGPRIGKLIGSIVVRSRCMCVCVCVCVCACVCVCVYMCVGP